MSSVGADRDSVINFGKSSSSVYDKLYELCSAIEDAIRHVSNDARANVETDIMRLKRDANRGQVPEVEYASLLFKKYTEETMTLSRSDDSTNILGVEIAVPTFLYEGTAEQLSGMESTKKNIFWMRATSLVFSFLCCIIMGLVPDISYASMHPNNLFNV